MSVNFDFRKRLGSGYFGEVWLAREAGLDTDRAVKLIPQAKVSNQENFFHEAQVLKAAEHPNVVRVEDTGTMEDGRIYVAMEYLPKGSLEDEASGAYVDLTRVRRIMVDTLRGLEHAYLQGILHRDIKPANILVGASGEGKLSDFGLAIPIGVNPRSIGMKGYMYTLHSAPEVHTGSEYNMRSEIYACGMTLYRLVNGDNYLPPWSSAINDVIQSGRFHQQMEYREFIPRPVRALINKATNPDPMKRHASANALRRSLEQLNLEMNWNEVVLPNGMKWICGWNGRTFEVVRERLVDGRWRVIVRKGRNKKSLRRVTELCADQLTKAKASQKSRQILQSFVLGKL